MSTIGWADLPAWVLAGIVVLGLAQLSLQALALASVFRTPQERLVTGKRWVWILAIALGIVGAIAYFAAARRPALTEDPVQSVAEPSSLDAQAQRAVDLLYGTSSEETDRSDRR